MEAKPAVALFAIDIQVCSGGPSDIERPVHDITIVNVDGPYFNFRSPVIDFNGKVYTFEESIPQLVQDLLSYKQEGKLDNIYVACSSSTFTNLIAIKANAHTSGHDDLLDTLNFVKFINVQKLLDHQKVFYEKLFKCNIPIIDKPKVRFGTDEFKPFMHFNSSTRCMELCHRLNSSPIRGVPALKDVLCSNTQLFEMRTIEYLDERYQFLLYKQEYKKHNRSYPISYKHLCSILANQPIRSMTIEDLVCAGYNERQLQIKACQCKSIDEFKEFIMPYAKGRVDSRHLASWFYDEKRNPLLRAQRNGELKEVEMDQDRTVPKFHFKVQN